MERHGKSRSIDAMVWNGTLGENEILTDLSKDMVGNVRKRRNETTEEFKMSNIQKSWRMRKYDNVSGKMCDIGTNVMSEL